MGQLLSVLYSSSAAAVLPAHFGKGDFIEDFGRKIELEKTCNAQCALNGGGRFEWLKPAACRRFGRMLKQSFKEIIASAEKSETRNDLQKEYGDGDVLKFEHGKDGASGFK